MTPAGGEISCANCETEPSSVYCRQCKCALCDQCNTSIHAPRAMQKHPVSSLTTDHQPKLCEEHGEPLDYTCLRCKTLSCDKCKERGGKHHGHAHALVTNAVHGMKKQLQEVLPSSVVVCLTPSHCCRCCPALQSWTNRPLAHQEPCRLL